MDQKGQISAEYILLVFGLIIVIMLVFAVAVTNESELNTVTTDARIGADNGTTQLSINNSNMSPVRVTGISMNNTNDNNKYISITINLSGTITSAQSGNLMSSVMNSMNSLTSQGYNVSDSSDTVTSGKHVYNIGINTSDISG
jgi:uncharacterized protein (UPF0333 family)